MYPALFLLSFFFLSPESLSAMPSRGFSLYRRLLRYGQSLRFTDKDYFAARVRDEFERSRHHKDKAQIDFAVGKGEALLRKGRLV